MSYELAGPASDTGATIVLLHGFGASMESWSDIHPALVARHRVLRIDLKGFGRTGKPRDDKYSVHDQADVVVGVLRELGIRRSILVGHSLGGAVAYASYLRLRDGAGHRVEKLALVDAGIYRQKLPVFIAALRNPISRYFSNRFTSARWRARFALESAFENDRTVTDERVQRYAQYLDAPGSHYSFQKVAEQIVPPDAERLEKALPTIRVPVLALWGNEDPIVPVDFAHRLGREVPGAHVSIIGHVGHVPHEELPGPTAELLLAFIEGR